jgi:hypothetical protein
MADRIDAPACPTETQPGDLASLSLQATADLAAAREGYRALACVLNLIVQIQGSSAECLVSRAEAAALVDVVNTEAMRRMQIAKATAALMQVESTDGG